MEKKLKLIGEMDNSDGTLESANRVYEGRGAAPTIPTACGGGHIPKTVKIIGGVGEENEFGKQYRQQNRVYSNKAASVSMTGTMINGLYTRRNDVGKDKTVEDYLITAKDGNQYGIFKLSPRECARLQNFRDADIDKMLAVNSNTRVYMQTGNAICVSVLVGIFSQLGIKGVKRWNSMTDDERYEIIKPGG